MSPQAPVRILGVDPGSRLTGFGIIEWNPSQRAGQKAFQVVAHGTLKLAKTSGRQETPLTERLALLHAGLSQVVAEHRPRILSLERVFFAKNAVSALKLGQARGAILLTATLLSLDVVEYSPSEVKATLVGHGHAEKDQVARMLKLLLGRPDLAFDTADASDALALAVCHAQLLSQGGQRTAFEGYASSRTSRAGSIAQAIGIERFVKPKD